MEVEEDLVDVDGEVVVAPEALEENDPVVRLHPEPVLLVRDLEAEDGRADEVDQFGDGV